MTLLKQWLPVFLWAGLILSSANDLFSARETGGLLQWLFGGPVHPAVHVAVRKLAHVVAYGILGALTWRADRRWIVIIAIALGVAGTDEWLQSRSAMRTGTPWDVLLDVIAAIGVRWLCHRFSTGSPAASASPSPPPPAA